MPALKKWSKWKECVHVLRGMTNMNFFFKKRPESESYCAHLVQPASGQVSYRRKESKLKKKRSSGSVQQWDALKVTSIKLHQILMTSEPLTGPPGRQTSPFSKGGCFKKPRALWCNTLLLFCFNLVLLVRFSGCAAPSASAVLHCRQRDVFSDAAFLDFF